MLLQSNNNYQNYQAYQPSQNYQANQYPKNYQVYQPFQNYHVHPNYKIITSRQDEVDNMEGPKIENLDTCLLTVSKSICKIKIDKNKGFSAGSGFF